MSQESQYPVQIENINPVVLFAKNGVEPLLKEIEDAANSLVPDTSTSEGRKAIASMAHKVAKSKTYLDGLGKDLVSEWKLKSKAVDAERKKMRDQLDALKTKVRKPLDEWEQAEAARIEIFEQNLKTISDLATLIKEGVFKSLSDLERNLATLESINVDDSWDEYFERATEAKTTSHAQLTDRIQQMKKSEVERLELERLRQEAAERELKDHQEKLAHEAEKAAKVKAEQDKYAAVAAEKAQKERDERIAQEAAKAERLKHEQKQQAALDTERKESERLENERKAAVQAKEQAELRARLALEESERKAFEAVEQERLAVEARKQKEAAEAKAREENKKHRAKINNESVQGLIAVGLNDKQAKAVVTAIAKREIPHVTIAY